MKKRLAFIVFVLWIILLVTHHVKEDPLSWTTSFLIGILTSMTIFEEKK